MRNRTSFRKGYASKFLKNEIGNRYGKLLVIDRAEDSNSGNVRWNCLCDCGISTVAQAGSLRGGRINSCGCARLQAKRSGEAIYNNSYRLTKYQSSQRGISFSLTLDNYKTLMLGKCNYCGRCPYNSKYAYHKTRYTIGKLSDEVMLLNGIDRVDSAKGYVLENCVSCCKYCNRAKSDLSISDFKNLIFMIYKNLSLDGE